MNIFTFSISSSETQADQLVNETVENTVFFHLSVCIYTNYEQLILFFS